MKSTLTLLLLVATTALMAQDAQYNKWSFELQGGAHAVSDNFTEGYFTETASFFQASAGVRYMFNNKIGTKLSFGYNSIENDDESLAFENDYYRVSLEGVVNFGPILGLNEICKGVTVLGHGGFGYSSAKAENINFGQDEDDAMAHFILGLTPQFKLSERITFITDVSLLGHIGQEVTWDGQSGTEGNFADGNQFRNDEVFTSLIVNASAGISINLGSQERHADWYYEEDARTEVIDSLRNRITAIEDDMIDDDKDGVPNYLDQDNTTESGVAVDTRGRAIDANNNGIPDEMEAPLDARYAQQGEVMGNNASSGDMVRELLDNGYVNVYFKFNSTEPSDYSLGAINYLVKYMQENPSANAELIGYADEIGAPAYNETLSNKRAKKVYDVLVASGIDASRLSHTGSGEDASVDKSSAPARQLMRRVTFKLK